MKEEIQDAILRKRRADELLKGLSSEKQKWIVCTRMLSSKYETVGGDVVLAAAYITFAGAFTQSYRAKLVQKWQYALQSQDLPYNNEF